MTNPLRRHRREHTEAADAQRLAAPWAARLTRIGLWTLVGAGALGGLVAAVRPTTTVVEPAAHQQAAPPDGIAGVAEIAARQWLTGETRADRPATSDPTLAVDAAAAIAVREITADYWAVTVAAALRGPASNTPTVWYLEVGVTRTNDGLRPVGSPAVVPGPNDATPLPGAAATLASPAQDDPIAATAEAFLRALLTGAGDPIRYVAPDAAISAINQAPFVDLTVERTAVLDSDPTRTVLRVAVNATTADGVELETAYELVLVERDGRWEIKAVSGAPTLPRAHAGRSTSSTPATVPPSTTTSAPSPGA